MPADDAGDPTTIFEGGRTVRGPFTSRTFNPVTGAGGPITATTANNQPAWGNVRGAFYLNGRIWYGYSDGKFYYRTFDGSTFGNAVKIDPYKDPAWTGVKSGSFTKSEPPQPIYYDGAYPGFYGSQIKNVTAMFYWNKAIYYTLAGKAALYKRAFSPDTAQVSGTLAVGVSSARSSRLSGAAASVPWPACSWPAASSGSRGPRTTARCTRSIS